MHTIHANDASPKQLEILLGLRPHELERLLAARPFPDLFAFRRALPYRVAASQRTLDISKLDLNAVSRETLVTRTGLAPAVADALIERRPFFFLNELRHVRGITRPDIDLLTSIAAIPELSYVDKSSGRAVSLEPDPSKVVVTTGEQESAGDIAAGLGLRRTFRRATKSGPQVFTIPETESADDVLGQLRQKVGVDKALPGFQEQGEQRFIDPEYCVVQFRPDVPEERQNAILAAAGLELAERHRSAGLVTVHVPDARRQPAALTETLRTLNAHPEVEFAEPNFLGFDDAETVVPAIVGGTHWHLDLIGAEAAWTFGQGSPDVIVAVVDTGVDLTHPALRAAILARGTADDWDFTLDGGNDPLDEEGHGTFIAGILAGDGTQDVQGLCPGCRLLPLRVPLSGQTSSYARRADAILYAVEYAAGRPLVINTSWKTTGDVAVVRRAIATALEHRAVVVASAGNDPDRRNQPHFPSDYPGVLSVAAVGPDGSRAGYSFYGDRIDVAAPGGSGADKNDPTQDLLSTAPAGGVMVAYGTSFAAPHVAGLAALILSCDPALTPAQVAALIRDTARPLRDDGVGRGLIDAGAAVARARIPATASGEGLAAINRGDFGALTTRFGLRRLTAHILIARRPIDDITRIRNTLGLTPDQYAALAA